MFFPFFSRHVGLSLILAFIIYLQGSLILRGSHKPGYRARCLKLPFTETFAVNIYVRDFVNVVTPLKYARFASHSVWTKDSDDSGDEEKMYEEAQDDEHGAPQRSGKLLVLKQILPLWRRQVRHDSEGFLVFS